MARSVDLLSHIGEKTSDALEAYAKEREHAIAIARRRLLEAPARAVERRSQRPVYLAAAFSFAALLLLLVGVFRLRAPLEFTADGRPGGLEDWVAAPVDRPLALDFSDGSAFLVRPTSRARVVAVERGGATIALENGGLDARVVHRPDSAWNVIAGPLTVRVTGTRFGLNWSAAEGVLSVSVEEGSVTVGGAFIGAAHAVSTGQALRVVVGERRVEWTPGLPAKSGADAGPPAALEQVGRALTPSSAPSAGPSETIPRPQEKPSAEKVPASEEPEWRKLIRTGSLRAAFAAAEARGFDRVCQEATAAELLSLGDGARLAGRPDRANQALGLLRSRYPRDPRRAAAAFALGKVAFDEARDYRQAAEWFSTSVREQPGGSLSREARGRLLEALQRAGDTARAKRAAEEYLERHPSGPHAALARSILR
jgi:transmembrane sensor